MLLRKTSGPEREAVKRVDVSEGGEESLKYY